MRAIKKILAVYSSQSQGAKDLLKQLTYASQKAGVASDSYAMQLPFDNKAQTTLFHWLTKDLGGDEQRLLVGIGGDGTILSLAPLAAVAKLPLLGIHSGRVGFLADLMPDDIETGLQTVLANESETIKRSLLRFDVVSINGGQENSEDKSAQVAREIPPYRDLALNEVVLHSGVPGRLLEFNLFADDEHVYTVRSDGMIISTPTGSTAYSLSAGGSALHPTLDVVSIVPMLPYGSNISSLVLPIDCRLRFETKGDTNISVDGQQLGSVGHDMVIEMSRATESLTMIQPSGGSFYRALRTKMRWGSLN